MEFFSSLFVPCKLKNKSLNIKAYALYLGLDEYRRRMESHKLLILETKNEFCEQSVKGLLTHSLIGLKEEISIFFVIYNYILNCE